MKRKSYYWYTEMEIEIRNYLSKVTLSQTMQHLKGYVEELEYQKDLKSEENTFSNATATTMGSIAPFPIDSTVVVDTFKRIQ